MTSPWPGFFLAYGRLVASVALVRVRMRHFDNVLHGFERRACLVTIRSLKKDIVEVEAKSVRPQRPG